MNTENASSPAVHAPPLADEAVQPPLAELNDVLAIAAAEASTQNRVMRVLSLLLLLPLPALASNTGVVGMSGKVLHCGQCHNRTGSFFDEAPPEQAALVQISAPAPLALGSSAILELLVESRGPVPDRERSGGVRGLGFDLAVSQFGGPLKEAGALTVVDEVRTRTSLDELTHVAPIAFDEDGKARISFGFTPGTEGTHAFHLAVNDVDRDGLAGAGDLVTPHVICFDVGAPTSTELPCTSMVAIVPPEPEPDPGPTGDTGSALVGEVGDGPDASLGGDTSRSVVSGGGEAGGCRAGGGEARDSSGFAIVAVMLALLTVSRRRANLV